MLLFAYGPLVFGEASVSSGVVERVVGVFDVPTISHGTLDKTRIIHVDVFDDAIAISIEVLENIIEIKIFVHSVAVQFPVNGIPPVDGILINVTISEPTPPPPILLILPPKSTQNIISCSRVVLALQVVVIIFDAAILRVDAAVTLAPTLLVLVILLDPH